MRLCSIASGSSGNCIYVGSEETHVLVDAGISGKRIEQGLNQLEITGRDIDAILVTHEHSDHISGLGVMARRYHIPVYTTGGTADAISRMKNMQNLPEDTFHEIVEDQDFHIKDLTIILFPFLTTRRSRLVTVWSVRTRRLGLLQTLGNITIT